MTVSRDFWWINN